MLSADGLPTRLVVTRSGIRTRRTLHRSFRSGFAAESTLSYHSCESATAARRLVPVIFGADGSTGKLLRTFEMVAASKPTSRLSRRSHFLCH